MSQDEEINIVYLLKDIQKKQEDHIKASNDFRADMKSEMTAIKTHAGYAKIQLDSNTENIESLKSTRTKQNGALWAFGIIWTAIITFLGLQK